MEENLAQSIADSHWRIYRAVAIEDNIFAAEAWHEAERAAEKGYDYDGVDRALAPMRTFTNDPKRFHLLTTYEMRLHRKAQVDLKQLRDLQAERRAEQARNDETKRKQPTVDIAPPPARQPADITAIRPQNGFVCSPAPLPEKPSDREIEKFFSADPSRQYVSQPSQP